MDHAARADASYYAAWRALTRAMDGGIVSESDGLLLTVTGLPVAWLNIAFVTRPLPRPREQLAAAMALYGDRGLGFVVRIREGLDPAAESACEALGMPYSDTVPGMVSTTMAAPDPPAGLHIEAVSTPAQLADFCAVIGRGYEMPEEHARAMFPLAILQEPEVESFLGYCDGVPAATSTLVYTGRVAGVHNVATVPEYRKRGFGEALTWHGVAAGAGYGCDMAALQASEMGQPIYERMGFRVLSPYRTFHLPGV